MLLLLYLGKLWQLKLLRKFGYVTTVNLAKYIFNVEKIHHFTRFMLETYYYNLIFLRTNLEYIELLINLVCIYLLLVSFWSYAA